MLLVGSREIAEDVVQTAFLHAHARWDVVDNPGAYLRQIVVNQAKDSQRRAYRRPRPGREAVTEIPEIDDTWNEVRRLPPVQRAVVVLRFYEDLSLTEISNLLDRPAPTVRSDLRRGLIRLRRTLT